MKHPIVPIIQIKAPLTIDAALLKAADVLRDPQDLNEALAAVQFEEMTKRLTADLAAQHEARALLLLIL